MPDNFGAAERVEIDPAPLRLLRHFIANRGRTIRHDELRQVLWPGQTVVTSDAIPKTVVYQPLSS
jgi:DNA-binding winged helix-turn-helix (wHTH) protein